MAADDDDLGLLPHDDDSTRGGKGKQRGGKSNKHIRFVDEEPAPTASSVHESFERFEADSHPDIVDMDHQREARYSKRSHTRILRSLPNFRDVGGQRSTDGRIVRPGLVFRGASVNKIDPDEVPVFTQQLGIRTLVDLRHKPFSGQLGPLAAFYTVVQRPQDAPLRAVASDPAVSLDPDECKRDPYLALGRRFPTSPVPPTSPLRPDSPSLSSSSSPPTSPRRQLLATPTTPLHGGERTLGGVRQSDRGYSTPARRLTAAGVSIELDDPGVVAGRCYPIQLTGLSFYMRFVSHVPVRTWCQVLADVFCCRTRLTKARISGSVLSPLGLEGLYRMFLEASTKEILSVLRLYANPANYPIVVYCNHGKDRTGIIIALVLSICYVNLDSIILNYSESHHHLAEWHEEIRDDFRSTGVDPDEFAHTPQEVMRDTIQYINAAYGSVAAYLRHIGLSEEDQARIRSILLCRLDDDEQCPPAAESIAIPSRSAAPPSESDSDASTFE